MIYLMATIRVAPDKMDKFKEVFREYISLGSKHGRKLVGQWETAIGPHVPREITDLWVFEDLADRQRYQEAAAKDKELQEVVARLYSCVTDEVTKILVPMPASPLK